MPGLPVPPEYTSQQWLHHTKGQDTKASSMITDKVISLCTTISSTLNKVESLTALCCFIEEGKRSWDVYLLMFWGSGDLEQRKACVTAIPQESSLLLTNTLIPNSYSESKAPMQSFTELLFGWFNISILSRFGAGTNLSISLGMNIQFLKSSCQYRGQSSLGATRHPAHPRDKLGDPGCKSKCWRLPSFHWWKDKAQLRNV